VPSFLRLSVKFGLHIECPRSTLRQHIHHASTEKPDLDLSDGKSYQPISNLTVLSKVLERLVARQLVSHLSEWKLLPELQSAYRAYHSTETAVFRVASDVLEALDRGELAQGTLTLLDLSAAFDMLCSFIA